MSINASVLNKINANKIQEHVVEDTGNWLPSGMEGCCRISTPQCGMNTRKCRSYVIISKDASADPVHHSFMIKSPQILNITK